MFRKHFKQVSQEAEDVLFILFHPRLFLLELTNTQHSTQYTINEINNTFEYTSNNIFELQSLSPIYKNNIQIYLKRCRQLCYERIFRELGSAKHCAKFFCNTIYKFGSPNAVFLFLNANFKLTNIYNFQVSKTWKLYIFEKITFFFVIFIYVWQF